MEGSSTAAAGPSPTRPAATAPPSKPPASKVQCGSEAVKLLNCLAVKGSSEACSAEVKAFVACAGKSGLKEFLLLEECPAPPAVIISDLPLRRAHPRNQSPQFRMQSVCIPNIFCDGSFGEEEKGTERARARCDSKTFSPHTPAP